MGDTDPTMDYLKRDFGKCQSCGISSMRRLYNPDGYICPKCKKSKNAPDGPKGPKGPEPSPNMFEVMPDHVWANANEPDFLWLLYGPNCILVKRVVEWTAPKFRRGES